MVLRCLLRCLIRVMFKLIDFMCVFLPCANEVWGKVIFSVACVKNSVHRGGTSSSTPPPRAGTPNPPGQVPPGRYPLGRYPPGLISPGHLPPGHRYTPRAGTPLGRYTPRTSTCWEIWATSGRYASYWNAFLLHTCVILFPWGVGFPACTGKGGLAFQHALGKAGGVHPTGILSC